MGFVKALHTLSLPVSRPVTGRQLVFRKAHQSGFTLFEIMLVLVILGVMLGLASLAVPDSRANQLQNEGSRLSLVLAELQLEALLAGQAMGLALSGDSYQPMYYDNLTLEWKGGEQALMALHTLPEGMSVELLSLEDESSQVQEDQDQPDIRFDRTGTGQPFRLRLYIPEYPEYERVFGSDGFQRVITQ